MKDAEKLAIVLVTSLLINVVVSFLVRAIVIDMQSITGSYLVFGLVSVSVGCIWSLILFVGQRKKIPFPLWVGIPTFNLFVLSFLFAMFAGAAISPVSKVAATAAHIAGILPVCGIIAEWRINTGRAKYEFIGAGAYFVAMAISLGAFLLS